MAWGQSLIPFWTGSGLGRVFAFQGETNNDNLYILTLGYNSSCVIGRPENGGCMLIKII